MNGKPINLMTIREIARTGIISEHYLRQLVKAKKIPTIKVGEKSTRNLINYDYLVEWLISQSVPAAEQNPYEEKKSA